MTRTPTCDELAGLFRDVVASLVPTEDPALATKRDAIAVATGRRISELITDIATRAAPACAASTDQEEVETILRVENERASHFIRESLVLLVERLADPVEH